VELTLRTLRIPVLVLVPPTLESQRWELEATSDFDSFVNLPLQVDSLRTLLVNLGLMETPSASQEVLADWQQQLARELAHQSSIGSGEAAGGSGETFAEFSITDTAAPLLDAAPPPRSPAPSSAAGPGTPPVRWQDEAADPASLLQVTAPHEIPPELAFQRTPSHQRVTVPVSNPVPPSRRPSVEGMFLPPRSGESPLEDPTQAATRPGGQPAIESEAPRRATNVRTAEHAVALDDAMRRVSTTSTANRAVSISGSRRTVSPTDSGSGEVPAPAQEAPAARRVARVTMTGLRAGMITGLRVPRVLAGLMIHRASGLFQVVQEMLVRQVILRDGVPGVLDAEPSAEDLDRFLGTFAWETGSYLFEPADVPEARFRPFDAPLAVLWQGIVQRLSVDAVMRPLTPFLKRYPVLTEFSGGLEQDPRLLPVLRTLRALHGGWPLERAIVMTQEAPDDVLRRAYYGYITGALVFEDSPSDQPLALQISTDFGSGESLEVESVRRLTDTMMRRRRSTNVEGAQVVAAGSPVQMRTPAPAPSPAPSAMGLSSEQVETHRQQLTRLSQQLRTLPPIQALGLPEGSPLSAVTARYYELIRQYHPDRYTRDFPEDVRQLAQQAFLDIRQAYEQAQRQIERGDVQVTRAEEPAATGAPGPRKVSDVLARVRARHAQAGPSPTARPAGTSPSSSVEVPPVTLPPRTGPETFTGGGMSSRQITTLPPRPASVHSGQSTEVLFRNAKRALVSGANAKALELLEEARERGLEGPSVEAHHLYLRYALREISAVQVVPELERIAEGLGEDPSEASQVWVLIGHVLRLEDRLAPALEYYLKAIAADKVNEEANRWARHLRSRGVDRKDSGQGQSFFGKLLNTKLTITPTRKS
jgi:tetratricopeptide (TPR) repeat protein